jgi:hypothetical protein
LKAQVENYWLTALRIHLRLHILKLKDYYMGSSLYVVIRKLLFNLAEHLSRIALEIMLELHIVLYRKENKLILYSNRF